MEVRAQLRNVPMGARKGRLVAELVRGKPCDEALSLLRACPRAAARPIAKLIQSALANAQIMNERKSAGLDLDNLIVKTICVDQATHSWRVRPRAMGRSYWVRKASSHVTVGLAEE